MAKPKAPLFGLSASGSIAKTIVFFGWKGINCAREWVSPTNPQTTDQQTQRGYMTAAVTEWHGAGYDNDDVSAWNRFAATLAKTMSGFNAMVRTHINEAILGNTWERIFNGAADTVTAGGFTVHCTMSGTGKTPTCYYGTRPTYMGDSIAMDDDSDNTYSKAISGLAADTKYFFYFTDGSSGSDYGRTGIYVQKTSAS